MYPVIVAYAIIAWLILQVGEVTFAPLGLPDWVMTALVLVAILGFPVAIALAWIYDFTPLGILREKAGSGSAAAGDERPSIAVLPFLDLSQGHDQAYFCEGVAEEILNALTRIPELRVAARSSSFRYRPEAGDVRKIGRDLGVRTILEGSVRKSGKRLRVTAQLVNVADGYHLWSRTFEEELEDVFAIQDEIASGIASSLLESMQPPSREAIRTTASADVNAYDFYLRGRRYFKRFRKADIEHARQMFRQAIKLDPKFALAWAGYADCHSFLMMYADPKPAYAETAQEASTRALELGADLAEAHASRGLALLVCRRFEDAEVEFRRAIELNPRLFDAYYYYARARFHQGDMDAAASLFGKAAAIDPGDYASRCLRVQILRGQGHIDEARSEAEKAIVVVENQLEWSPDDVRALHLGAGSLLVLGQNDRARRWLRRAYELDPDDPILLYNLACNFATMNEIEEALDYLDKAVEHGTISSDWMRNDEDLVNLRDNRRFVEILGRVANNECMRQRDPCE